MKTWPLESLSSDGIHFGFYRDNWDLVGYSITHIAHKILDGSQSLDAYNYSNLVLIPTSPNVNLPTTFGQFGSVIPFIR